MSSFKPSQRADQVQAGEVIARGLLVSRCDASKMLDGVEEALDEIAPGVKREVAIAFDLSV